MRIILTPLCVFLLLLSTKIVEAQFNIRVGYNVAKIDAVKHKNLIASFNSTESNLESGFPELNILHGFELGVRYNFGILGFDLGFANASRDRSASVYDSANDAYISQELGYSINSLSLGLENVFNKFGYGGTIGYNFFKVNSKLGDGNKIELVSDRYLSSRFYLMWNLQGSGSISLSIRPYYDVSWQNINLGGIQDGISSNTLFTNSELDETPTLFGISFLFYNGPQPRF